MLEFSLDMLPGPATVPHHPAAAWAAAAEEEDWMALALGAVARGCPKLQRVHVASSALSDKAAAAFLRCVLIFETGFTGLSNAGGAARLVVGSHFNFLNPWVYLFRDAQRHGTLTALSNVNGTALSSVR